MYEREEFWKSDFMIEFTYCFSPGSSQCVNSILYSKDIFILVRRLQSSLAVPSLFIKILSSYKKISLYHSMKLNIVIFLKVYWYKNIEWRNKEQKVRNNLTPESSSVFTEMDWETGLQVDKVD